MGPRMESLFFDLALTLAISGFAVWFTFLSAKLHRSIDLIEGTDDRIDEIAHSVEVVAGILGRLPELVPQFHMNNNPLQPIIDQVLKNWGGTEQLKTEPGLRGPEGRFEHGTKESETEGPA